MNNRDIRFLNSMKPEQERLKNLLCDTITMLCKNGLGYKRELKVQGLVAVTVDDNDVFIVHLNERLEDAVGGFVIPVDCNSLMDHNFSSAISNQHPDASQNLADIANKFVSSSEAPVEPRINEKSSCAILKVETFADDGEEENAVNLSGKEESMNVDGEVDGQTFDVGLACSCSRDGQITVDFRSKCETNSSAVEVSKGDLGLDVEATVALVSTSVHSVAHEPVQTQNGTVHQSGQMFPNVLPNISNVNPSVLALTNSSTHAKIPLPKLMRSYLPIVPGFTGRQQVEMDSFVNIYSCICK